MKQGTSEWINSAHEDIIVIESVMSNEYATCAASFHAQQCIEKTLKAILEENRQNIPRIHDLKRLFSLTECYLKVEYNEKIIDKINTLYIESRYPGAFGLLPDGKPSLENVKDFYESAGNIFDVVNKYLTIREFNDSDEAEGVEKSVVLNDEIAGRDIPT